MKDYLTGLYSERYLKSKYQEYLEQKENVRVIIIDLKKFKKINDTFGHAIGDKYLIVFSKILKKCFDTSIVCRLHGDEFAILTSLEEKEIESAFHLVNEMIIEALENEEIPVIFEYNAGSCLVTNDLTDSMNRADYMMYHAKKDNRNYQCYDESIWEEKVSNDRVLATIDTCIKEDEFIYLQRKLHLINGDYANIIQLSVSDNNGIPIFQNINYEFIRNTFQGIRIDLNNIKFFSENIKLFNEKVIVTLDYATILSIDNLKAYLDELQRTYGIDFNKVILNINVVYITNNHYEKMFEVINILKEYGIEVCLDQYNGANDYFLLESDIDYLKFGTQFWKRAMYEERYAYYLQKKIELLDGYYKRSIPIFMCVDTIDEVNFLEKFLPTYSLIAGNYFSECQNVVRKRVKSE